MAGSLMSSVSGVNNSLKEMMTEESRDSLQSWVVGKNSGPPKATGDTPEMAYKGSKPPRLVDPFKVDTIPEDGEEEADEEEKPPDPEEE
eukprot:symbB.v1.2.039113.t1/scaffold6356.1/size18794/1